MVEIRFTCLRSFFFSQSENQSGGTQTHPRTLDYGLSDIQKEDSDLGEKEIEDCIEGKVRSTVKSCGYMSRIRPWVERSMPMEERHPSTDLREERGQERKSGFGGGPFGNRRGEGGGLQVGWGGVGWGGVGWDGVFSGKKMGFFFLIG
ncbi:hypothetical protein ACFX2H_027684 [Malus domestica]